MRLSSSVLLCLFFLACSGQKDEAPAKATVKGLPEKEVARARTACKSYVARVCACAESRAALADECALSRAIPEALELNLDLSTTPGLSNAERQAVRVEARKIAAGCFEADGKLDPVDCPR